MKMKFKFKKSEQNNNNTVDISYVTELKKFQYCHCNKLFILNNKLHKYLWNKCNKSSNNTILAFKSKQSLQSSYVKSTVTDQFISNDYEFCK